MSPDQPSQLPRTSQGSLAASAGKERDGLEEAPGGARSWCNTCDAENLLPLPLFGGVTSPCGGRWH